MKKHLKEIFRRKYIGGSSSGVANQYIREVLLLRVTINGSALKGKLA